MMEAIRFINSVVPRLGDSRFWTYCELALETRDAAEYRVIDRQVERKRLRHRSAG
jgi:hypothetical protein